MKSTFEFDTETEHVTCTVDNDDEPIEAWQRIMIGFRDDSGRCDGLLCIADLARIIAWAKGLGLRDTEEG